MYFSRFRLQAGAEVCFKRAKDVAETCRKQWGDCISSKRFLVGVTFWRTKSTNLKFNSITLNTKRRPSAVLGLRNPENKLQGDYLQARDEKGNSIYTYYRENSQRLRHFRNDYFSRASRAYSQGKGGLAKRLSEQGHLMNKALIKAEEKAASHILEAENRQYNALYTTKYRTLNLHGLHVKEAVTAVQRFVDKHLESSDKVVIITGWGHNSYPNKARLAPAVSMFLDKQGHCYEEVKPGVYEVSMYPRMNIRLPGMQKVK